MLNVLQLHWIRSESMTFQLIKFECTAKWNTPAYFSLFSLTLGNFRENNKSCAPIRCHCWNSFSSLQVLQGYHYLCVQKANFGCGSFLFPGLKCFCLVVASKDQQKPFFNSFYDNVLYDMFCTVIASRQRTEQKIKRIRYWEDEKVRWIHFCLLTIKVWYLDSVV